MNNEIIIDGLAAFTKQARRPEKVEVEPGTFAFFRRLGLAEYDEYKKKFGDDKEGEITTERMRTYVEFLVSVIVNEQGDRVFKDDQIDEIMAVITLDMVQKYSRAFMHAMGLSDEEVAKRADQFQK